MADLFGRILVPVEEVVELKGARRAFPSAKFFPGYVLVEMDMNDDTWHLVKSTPKVTGFVGGTAPNRRRFPRRKSTRSCSRCRRVEKPRPKVLFETSEVVRVKEGPVHRTSTVQSRTWNYEKNKLRVSVTIFGRSTPVETGFRSGRKA